MYTYYMYIHLFIHSFITNQIAQRSKPFQSSENSQRMCSVCYTPLTIEITPIRLPHKHLE